MHYGIFALALTFFANHSVAGTSNETLRAQLDLAHSTYLKGNFESRQEAMLSLSKLLESVDTKTRNEAVGPNALAVTYIRLGILAKEDKKLSLAGKYFNQGLQNFRLNDTSMTLEELVETTHDLDNFARQLVRR